MLLFVLKLKKKDFLIPKLLKVFIFHLNFCLYTTPKKKIYKKEKKNIYNFLGFGDKKKIFNKI